MAYFYLQLYFQHSFSRRFLPCTSSQHSIHIHTAHLHKSSVHDSPLSITLRTTLSQHIRTFQFHRYSHVHPHSSLLSMLSFLIHPVHHSITQSAHATTHPAQKAIHSAHRTTHPVYTTTHPVNTATQPANTTIYRA